ncbi:hypothetical protein KQX54_007611 [Cotesia glomerata]|uniref:Uncharacterized protein n=1 Tax=Cotesia glomerata TaxID=32391 RepID=A0AAV7HZ44_COTGL|nr:hypothetical protein KQX54_007611 [Cotesia glomerata]
MKACDKGKLEPKIEEYSLHSDRRLKDFTEKTVILMFLLAKDSLSREETRLITIVIIIIVEMPVFERAKVLLTPGNPPQSFQTGIPIVQSNQIESNGREEMP